MASTPFHTANLTAEDAQHLKAIDEFFSVPKSRRSKTTFKDTLSHFTTDELEIWITLHQLSLWCDPDFVGKTALCRGHIVEKHYIKLPDNTVLTHYQDYAAHPKFANLNQHGFPEASRAYLEAITDHNGVYLFKKESGSMNIAVFPPGNYYIYRDLEGKVTEEEIYRSDHYHSTNHPGWHISSMYQPNGDHTYSNVTAAYSYRHPLTHYITSKNGWKNEYAEAGEVALKRCLEARGQNIESLCAYLHKHERCTVVYELMQFQEHVYADTKEEIYVHMIDNCKTSTMSMFIKDYLPVVGLVGAYDNVTAALQRWTADNKDCNHELEGYVLVIVRQGTELKVKLKFWKYLVLREFRETLNRRVCPTEEELAEKYKLWGVPSEQWSWYISCTREWFWWSRSSFCSTADKAMLGKRGKYIAIRDKFLDEALARAFGNVADMQILLRSVTQNEPVMLYFVLTGVQCIGKSRFRELLHKTYPGFVRSQDDCGGSRANLIKEINNWAESCEQPGLYITIIDRCNLNWDQRRALYKDLEKVSRTGFVYTINITEHAYKGKPLVQMLFGRFLARENHPSFSKESVGTIKGLEIIRDSLASYSHSPDGDTILYPHIMPRFSDLPVDAFTLIEYNKYGKYSVKSKPKFVYGGIAVPETSWHPYDIPIKDTWHGSHVTLVYGKGAKPLPEGEPVEITVLGQYKSKNICGMLVGVPGYTTLKHITLTTRNDVVPYQSNQVIIEEIFGKSPDYDDLGRNLKGIEWVTPYKLQGWYGNYYN